MAVTKCLIDHIKRSRFLDSADRVLVEEPAKERNVREKTPWVGRVGSVFMARFLMCVK